MFSLQRQQQHILLCVVSHHPIEIQGPEAPYTCTVSQELEDDMDKLFFDTHCCCQVLCINAMQPWQPQSQYSAGNTVL